MPELAEAKRTVEVISVGFPTLEAVFSYQPDCATATLTTLPGPDRPVVKRADFAIPVIPACLSPKAHATTLDAGDAYGSRADLP